MNGWILNIVGIVFIGVLIEIIMPEGKLNSFIKHLFSVFVLFVIVSPVSNFLKNTNSFVDNEIVLDSNYIYNANLNKIEEIENFIVETFEAQDIKGIGVIVNANVFSEIFKIDSIYIDVTNAVSKLEKDELYKVVKSTLTKNIDVLEENIEIYG